jgi:hypothetical protein
MENKKIYNDDVERIVNDPKKKRIADMRYFEREERQQIRLINISLILTIIGVLLFAVGSLGIVASWLSQFGIAICFLSAMFWFGRYFENAKIKGWK